MLLLDVDKANEKIVIDVVRMEDGADVYRLTLPYVGGKRVREAFKARLFPGKKGYWDSKAKQWVTSNDAITLDELVKLIESNTSGKAEVKPEINYRREEDYEVKTGPARNAMNIKWSIGKVTYMGSEYYTALVFNEATVERILGRDINNWSDVKRPDAKILAETFANLPRSPSWMKANDYNIKVLLTVRDDFRGGPRYVYAGGFCFLGRKTGGAPIPQGDRPDLFKYGVVLTWLQNSNAVPGLLTLDDDEDDIDFVRARRRRNAQKAEDEMEEDKIVVKTKAVVNIKDMPGKKVPANGMYMGRRNNRAGLKQSFFANPFPLKSERQRRSVVSQYEDYFYDTLMKDPKFESEIKKLLNYEYLVCYCAPKPCHCDIVLDYIKRTY